MLGHKRFPGGSASKEFIPANNKETCGFDPDKTSEWGRGQKHAETWTERDRQATVHGKEKELDNTE